ncbi:MAG TPA: type II toxin-antitoxin system Phd/YefM family antitoxin [Frankiaceae bacterium]|nr:type II toxin-antitoxin system Phd/YefM family antitoxin [Frankiaceae bacterium]
MSREVPVTQARGELSDLVSRVAFSGERVTLTRHGKAVAALVSAADLARLEALEEEPPFGMSAARHDPVPPGAAIERPFDAAAQHRPPRGDGGAAAGPRWRC